MSTKHETLESTISKLETERYLHDYPEPTLRQIQDLTSLINSEFSLEISLDPKQIVELLPQRLTPIFREIMHPVTPPDSAAAISELHYNLAQIVRAIGIYHERDSNLQPILNYYLNHEEPSTPYYRLDMIRYGIASEFYSQNFREKEAEMLVARETIISWNKTLKEKNKEVLEIEDRLTKAKNTHNFLGLSHAFSNLLARKKGEYLFYITMLGLLGVAALAIPLTNLEKPSQTIINTLLEKQFTDANIAKAVLIALVEVLILYYFKIMLQSWNQVKAQILQLELRVSLCAFAENYAEFSKKNVTGETLGKFETLIFSEITNEATPNINLFDATEALSKIASSFKKT